MMTKTDKLNVLQEYIHFCLKAQVKVSRQHENKILKFCRNGMFNFGDTIKLGKVIQIKISARFLCFVSDNYDPCTLALPFPGGRGSS